MPFSLLPFHLRLSSAPHPDSFYPPPPFSHFLSSTTSGMEEPLAKRARKDEAETMENPYSGMFSAFRDQLDEHVSVQPMRALMRSV